VTLWNSVKSLHYYFLHFLLFFCNQEAAKDAEFRTRLNEQLAEMQLAVEEQELQKAAAVKQGETAADEIQQHCTSLLAV